jgi:hypothetical protein
MKVPAWFGILLILAIPISSVAQSTRFDKALASMRRDPSASVFVGAGTGVPVHIVGTLSSGSAKADDVFQIQVNDDVVVGGVVVFRKGAGGQGHVAESDAAGGNGHSGAMALAFDYVYSVDGGRVKLSSATQTQSEEDRKGAASTATIIGYAAFGLGGLFGHNLVHGREKSIDEKTILNAFVADNVHVHSNERSEPAHYDE